MSKCCRGGQKVVLVTFGNTLATTISSEKSYRRIINKIMNKRHSISNPFFKPQES